MVKVSRRLNVLDVETICQPVIRGLVLASFGLIMKRFQRNMSRMEPSFDTNVLGKALDTGQEAIRSYWCPEYNLSSFRSLTYMKAALGGWENLSIYISKH